MSTEYRVKGINLSDFESIGDVKIVKYDGVTVIEFSSPFGLKTHVNKVIYNDHGNGRITLRRFGKDTNENQIRYLLFLIMCITGKGVISDDYGFEMGFPTELTNVEYIETVNRNKSFYDLDIRDQYEFMLTEMYINDRILELNRFELSGLTLENYLGRYYPKILVVKERGFRNRREEIECFLDYSSRYDGEYEDMDGNFVTSKEELEFREKTLKEINKFWDGFESLHMMEVMV